MNKHPRFTSSPKSLERCRESSSLRRDRGRSLVMTLTENRGFAQLASATGASLVTHREWAASSAGRRTYATSPCV